MIPGDASLVTVLSAGSQISDLIIRKQAHDYISVNNVNPSVTLYKHHHGHVCEIWIIECLIVVV